MENICGLCADALERADGFVARARLAITNKVGEGPQLDLAALEHHQVAVHGFAWMATYAEALRQILAWAQALEASSALGDLERLILRAAYAEYLAQLYGGIPLSQSEIIRPRDVELSSKDVHAFLKGAVKTLICETDSTKIRTEIAHHIRDSREPGSFGALGPADELLDVTRGQFRRFVDDHIRPHGHQWHLEDTLIPLPIIEKLAEMGVFGLTAPENLGGLGLGKSVMVAVTEELSRGNLAVGSLATRSEIAAELIIACGTDAQKEALLPGIISGEVIPTAVFTEPEAGSDLASLRTRAKHTNTGYSITGSKIWITHGARADLMTLLVRTDTNTLGHKGLSMFLAEKPRGTDADPFPASGMSGSEIPVLGYRGMKEYDIAFDGFEVPEGALLGGEEGLGFKQLMVTFETARIQTAARAVGVAQNALELGTAYAAERQQFRKSIIEFPRIAAKLGSMAVETMVARQLTLFAAGEKDHGRRADIQAGMAKLLASRTAWANADSALQIHGGTGYALEHPVSRVLLDARILNIFEGTGEIQAHVISRGLLADRN